jgi:hypothetical protein
MLAETATGLEQPKEVTPKDRPNWNGRKALQVIGEAFSLKGMDGALKSAKGLITS